MHAHTHHMHHMHTHHMHTQSLKKNSDSPFVPHEKKTCVWCVHHVCVYACMCCACMCGACMYVCVCIYACMRVGPDLAKGS